MKISGFAIKVDYFCDRIPIVSTLSNIIVLALKILIDIPSLKPYTQNHYFYYIRDKSTKRCLTLLLPFVGNFIVLYQDLKKTRLDVSITEFV